MRMKFLRTFFCIWISPLCAGLIHASSDDDGSCVVDECFPEYTMIISSVTSDAKVDESPEMKIHSSSFGSIIAIPGFFSSEECRKFRETPIPVVSSKHHGDKILVDDLEVGRDIAERLLTTFDHVENRPRRRKLEDIASWKLSNVSKILIQHMKLVSNGTVHQDVYGEGDHLHELVNGNSAAVVLNDNPDAAFVHGASDPIPIQEGTLFIFRGSEWHSTQIRSGHVHYFGPIDTDYFFPVGSPSPAPSAKPSTKPSAKPSVAPSFKPSVKPSAKPSAKPSLKPSAKPSTKPSTSLAPFGSTFC